MKMNKSIEVRELKREPRHEPKPARTIYVTELKREPDGRFDFDPVTTKEEKMNNIYERPQQARLINFHTGEHECPHCGAHWWANIKPQSGGKYYRGSKQCFSGCTRKQRLTN